MAGPGCGGRYEWFQHPSTFPYFCDGAAGVEKAHWQHWGAATAKAKATFNEAVLNSHDSVASAPRRLSKVTIVASNVKRCGGRRAYTSIVIHYVKPQKGPDRLKVASLLPGCSTPPAPHPGPVAAEFITRPGGAFVGCGMYAGTRSQIEGVRCQGTPVTAAGEVPLEQLAELGADGKVTTCSAPESAASVCEFGNFGSPIPTYSAGKRVRVGRYACEVLETGVECTIVADGKGFVITPTEVTAVGS